jgi:hypothetical protein
MHPLFKDASLLTENELEEKLHNLNKKYFQTSNIQVKEQITLLRDSYMLELESRRAKQKLEQQSENGNEGLDNLIKVS